jgi:2'-5' RNA ligase
MPAHVTVLYPFLAPDQITHKVEHDLESMLRSSPAFSFRLVAVDRFPGVLYLATEPAEPFRELAALLQGQWPEHPPYGGAFETVVPHVTVIQGSEPPEAAPQLEQATPIEAEATEVWLMAEQHNYWAVLKRFPLGPRTG